ncbi:MAG: alkaline phosphatase family protein [Candidatus Cloacimonetes bacterium]|nr:alkaline phosphatase family protein [Candidatus Cloacimonadota bacterium]
MKNLVYPDYNNSILNLISSIQNVYNVKTEHDPLKQLNLEELKTKQNIILMIFDGFGYNLLTKYKNTSCPFLAEHCIDKITSVFPSTTTSAMTSFYTGKSPIEHGSLGWSLYFKDYFKLIDFLPNRDSISGDSLNKEQFHTHDFLNIPNIFHKIKEVSPQTKVFYLKPKYLGKSLYSKFMITDAEQLSYKKTKQLFSTIKKTIKKKGKKFLFSYSTLPDSLEHANGIDAKVVEDHIREIDQRIKKLSSELTDTTILVTADHGLIDVQKYYYVNEDKDLNDCLILPAFPEPRFLSFFVKEHKINKFEKCIKKYEHDFLFLKREELFASNLLGFGKQHPKIDDFVGNYVAIGISGSAMRPIFLQNGKSDHELLAHHCGLTAAEMLVPLIRIDV